MASQVGLVAVIYGAKSGVIRRVVNGESDNYDYSDRKSVV